MVMNNHARYFPWRLPKISHKQVELVGNEKSIDDHKKMKRYDNIFDKIIDIKNIEKAIEKASKRKRNRRYMDDIVVFHTNKRKLRKTKDSIEEYLAKEHLKIKPNWQLFDLNKRFLDFLGFRFYKTHTTLRRNNFLRPKRRAKKIYRKGYISLKDASAMISYNGLIKNSNCHGYLTKYINPYVSINRCKKVVSKNAKGEKNEINKQ